MFVEELLAMNMENQAQVNKSRQEQKKTQGNTRSDGSASILLFYTLPRRDGARVWGRGSNEGSLAFADDGGVGNALCAERTSYPNEANRRHRGPI
jgi:hypothetical protein